MCRLKFNTVSGHMHFLASKTGACIEAMLLPMMSSRALMIHDFTPNAPPSRYSLAPKPCKALPEAPLLMASKL